MYVLTNSVNDYNQHGHYLIAIFNEKPTTDELCGLLCGSKINDLIEFGKLDTGDECYYLKELNNGQKYNHSK